MDEKQEHERTILDYSSISDYGMFNPSIVDCSKNKKQELGRLSLDYSSISDYGMVNFANNNC